MFRIKRLEEIITNNYFLLLFAAYAMNFFISFRPAVFLIGVNLILLIIRIIQNPRKITITPVLFFCFYLSISLLFSCLINRPSQALSSFLYIASPCILFFVIDNEKVNIDYLLFSFTVVSLINELVGTICFYTKPSFFVDFVYRTNGPAYEQLMHHAGFGRLITMFGSIETAQFAVLTIIVCLRFIYSHNKYRIISIIALIVSSVVFVLTQQRGPLFALVVGIIIVSVLHYREHLVRAKTILLFILVFAVAMYALYLYIPTVFRWIIQRITNPNQAIESRFDYQWNVLTTQLNPIEWIFGEGIGAFGFFVEESTITTRIFDQMYFNIIGEEGLVGLCIFLLIIFKCSIQYSKNLKTLFVPMFIVFEIAFTGLGTTLIYYPLIMPFFWASAGIILHNREYKTIM